MLNWKFRHKITVLKTWFFDIKEVTIYHSVETKEIMLSWKFWYKIAFLRILFCFNPFLEQRKLQFFISVETRNNVELKVLAQDRISQNTILLKPLLQQRKLKFNTRLKQKIMLANTQITILTIWFCFSLFETKEVFILHSVERRYCYIVGVFLLQSSSRVLVLCLASHSAWAT